LSGSLAAAVDLYNKAQFEEASRLLQQIEGQSSTAAAEDLKKLRLYQALVAVALNDSENAKKRFLELLTLEPAFALIREEYAPKVIGIFDAARTAYLDAHCNAICAECGAAAARGDFQKAISISKAARAECDCAREMADFLELSLIQKGMAAFQRGDFTAALKNFNTVHDANPGNETATDYSRRAFGEIESAISQAVSNWKVLFESKDYANAKSLYEQVVFMSADVASSAPNEIRAKYQGLFDRDTQLWSQACMRTDALAMDLLRQEIRAVDPTGSLNREALRQIQSCPVTGCTEVASMPTLERLRSRVDPKVDPALRPYATRIAVKIRIDDKGRVAVLDIDNPAGNPVVSRAVRDAVQQWKFDPEVAEHAATRCVVTEFQMEFEQ